MGITVTKFASLPSTPLLNPLNWAPGQNKGVRDPTSGDLCQWRTDGSGTAIELYTSQDNGATWARAASDATTPYTGALTGLMSVCLDATNGAVHFLMYDRTSTTAARGYGRATLVRSGGHVTGYTWAQTPFTLTTHASSSVDPRGTIIPVKRAGSEYLLYLIGLGNSSTVTTYYMGLSTSLTPSSSASFVGIDNTGSDTPAVDLTTDVTFAGNHQLCALVAQDDSTEDLYLFFGFMFTGDLFNNTGTSSSATWYKQIARSGSYWTAPTPTTAGTTIVSENASTIPTLMSVATAIGLGRAYVMVSDPNKGVKFYYLSSGTLTEIPDSPVPAANRGGYGSLSVDSGGRIYAIMATMALSDGNPLAYQTYFDGTKWVTYIDGSTNDTIGMGGSVPWSYGVSAIQEVGSSIAQTNTGARSSTIRQNAPIITSQPVSQYAAAGGTCTFSVTATAPAGSLSYQWQQYASGSWSNIVGQTSSSYTTGTLSTADNATPIRCALTDSVLGTDYSAEVFIFITGLPSTGKGDNIGSRWLAGGF